MKRWLLLLIGVGDQSRNQVDNKIGDTAMARMFDLADVLELIIDGLDQRAFSQQKLIQNRHQFVFHILLQLGDELHALLVEKIEQGLRNIAAISEQFAKQSLAQFRNWFAIVHVARGDDRAEQFATVVDDQMYFEAVEPADAGLASLGDSAKDLVGVDSAVVTNRDAGRINEGNAAAVAKARVKKCR